MSTRRSLAAAGAAAALVLVLLLVLLPGGISWGPASVPAGQRPLARLSPASFGDFAAAFDAGAAAPRLVLLLSPT
jgi:hypothetical protein